MRGLLLAAYLLGPWSTADDRPQHFTSCIR